MIAMPELAINIIGRVVWSGKKIADVTYMDGARVHVASAHLSYILTTAFFLCSGIVACYSFLFPRILISCGRWSFFFMFIKNNSHFLKDSSICFSLEQSFKPFGNHRF